MPLGAGKNVAKLLRAAFPEKETEKKGFLWKMFEPASQKNTMLTDMMGIHYK